MLNVWKSPTVSAASTERHVRSGRATPSSRGVVAVEGGSASQGTSDAKEASVKKWIHEKRNQRTAKSYASGYNGFAKYLMRENIHEDAIVSADVAIYLRERVVTQLVAWSTVATGHISSNACTTHAHTHA
jgi:hypothetical protein